MSDSNPARPQSVAQAEIRNINRSAVLNYLRLVRTASRTEIADEPNISLPSMHMLIEPIKNRLTGVIPRVPRIEESLLNDQAPLLGAVARVFQKHIDYSVVHSG